MIESVSAYIVAIESRVKRAVPSCNWAGGTVGQEMEGVNSLTLGKVRSDLFKAIAVGRQAYHFDLSVEAA